MKKLLTLAVLALLASAPKYAHATDDGTPSTGAFTVNYSTNLAAASATGSLTVVDVTTLSGAYFYIGPYQFEAGRDFAVGASTQATAVNIAAAINAFQPYGSYPYWVTASFSIGQTVLTITAQSPGTAYNGVGTKSSNTGEISFGASTLTGGLNNASFSVNGITLIQGRDWYALDSSSDAAISISAAINHAPGLKNLVSGYWTGGGTGVVYLRSLLNGTSYPLSVSDNSATNANLTPSGATMTGGTTGAFLAKNDCYLGSLDTLPTSNYPPGCLAYLNTNATNLYLSTQAVVGTQSWEVLTSSISATATLTSLTISGGPLTPWPRTKAQLAAITPAVGDTYSCSDCTLTYDIVVGTGAVIEGFRETGTNHGPQ